MATPQALTAVIRASRPDFKSAADKLVFAVHAIISVNGFSLRKLGDGVDGAVAAGPSFLPNEEAALDGWNAVDESCTYSFLYVPEPGTQRPPQQQDAAPPLLLLKCLRLESPMAPDAGANGGSGGAGGGGAGGVLLVSLADAASPRPPATLEMNVDRYVPSIAPGAAGGGFENLPELIDRVQGGLEGVLAGPQTTSTTTARMQTTATITPAGAATSSAQQQEAQRQEARRRQEEEAAATEAAGRGGVDPLRDDRFRGGMGASKPVGWGPHGMVGDEDLMPGGLPRPPGLGGLGGPGMGPPGMLGPRGGGGGMLVGPENPIFADRLRHPRGPPGGPHGGGGAGGAVPGMRWDPINPEGLQGWNPEDFTREGRTARREGFHDIGGPPPGRSADWDDMFG